ncbi:MAG: DUF1918 domain-containing protein [Nocardioidaceae bacterium]
MQAQVGERLLIHGKIVGSAVHIVEILEVHGADGGPPYLVKDPAGHQTLFFPGPDCEKQPAGNGGR